MRKNKIICILLAVLILLSAQAALAETPFKIGLYPLESESVQQLQSAHPELLLSSDVPPNTTDQSTVQPFDRPSAGNPHQDVRFLRSAPQRGYRSQMERH